MSVTSLPARGGFAPNPETLASSLEALAQAVRDGREDITSVIVVAQTSKRDVETYCFGSSISIVEGLGMLDYAKTLTVQETD